MDRLEQAGSDLRARMSKPGVPASNIEARGRRRRLVRRRLMLASWLGVFVVGGLAVARIATDEGGEAVLAHSGESEVDGAPTVSGPPATRGSLELPDGPAPTAPEAVLAELNPLIDVADLESTLMLTLDGVAVWLRPGREHLAAAIFERYGETVDLRVGGAPWPADPGAATPSTCSAPIPDASVAGVDAVLEVADARQRVGEGFEGTLVVHNGSESELRLSFDGNGAEVFVVQPGSNEVEGRYTGARLTRLESQNLPPGATGDPVRAYSGVASCRPEAGTAVQPGQYELVAVVRLPEGRAIVSNRVPVDVEA